LSPQREWAFTKTHAAPLPNTAHYILLHVPCAKAVKLCVLIRAGFETKGDISIKYDAFKEKIGESARALFVIDEQGIVRWSHLSPDGVNPGAEGILSALDQLNKPK